MELQPGTTFAGYSIERRLGAGGMGTVYLARHPRLKRSDALKILSDAHSADAEFQARFLREAEIAAGLQHPNVVAVRDRGEQDGRLWIAMQFVPGGDVTEQLRRGPIEPGRAVRIVWEAAQGLDEIHRAGLLHRDVKPANILLDRQPEGPERALITDFGIARRAEGAASLTGTGELTATLDYAAPEQLSGTELDQRVDVYALGCTLFHMLTGAVPYPRSSPGAVVYAHLYEEPPLPGVVAAWLPSGFDEVIATALAKNPADRYPSCGALAAAASQALGESSPSVTEQESAQRWNRWQRRIGIGALVAAAAIIAGTIVLALRVGDSVSTQSPPGSTPLESPWGAYAYVADAFPKLLPFAPMGVGHRELAECYPEGTTGHSAPLDVPVPTADVACVGNRDPVVTLNVYCNADRSLRTKSLFLQGVEGDSRWTRSSGSGSIRWGTFIDLDATVVGSLEVFFEDSNRNFCSLWVTGGASGAELRERWWPDAPL